MESISVPWEIDFGPVRVSFRAMEVDFWLVLWKANFGYGSRSLGLWDSSLALRDSLLGVRESILGL